MDCGTSVARIKNQRCDCRFYTDKELPCRHLIYLAVAEGKELQLRGNDRWKASHDEDILKIAAKRIDQSEEEGSINGNFHQQILEEENEVQPKQPKKTKAKTTNQKFVATDRLFNDLREALALQSPKEYNHHTRMLQKQLEMIRTGQPYHIAVGNPSLSVGEQVDQVDLTEGNEEAPRIVEEAILEEGNEDAPGIEKETILEEGNSQARKRTLPHARGPLKKIKPLEKYHAASIPPVFKDLEDSAKRKG